MKKNCLIKLLHPECGKCVAAPAPLSEALSVQWPECEKLHLAQIFEEVVLKERVLVVEEALHLVVLVVERVSFVDELLVAAGVSVLHSSAPGRVEARISSTSRTLLSC